MRRLSRFFLAAALAGIFIIAVGCATNPVTSEVVISSGSSHQDSVVYNDTSEDVSGGYPATPTTTIDKFESENDVQYLHRRP